MSKRAPDDVLSNGLLSSLAADNEAKKPKLDAGIPSALFTPFLPATAMNGLAASQVFASGPSIASQVAMAIPCSTPSSATSKSVTPRSKVVHLRNVPSDFVDVELLQLCSQHGNIVNHLVLKGKNQAFVEFEDEMSAQFCVATLQAMPLQIRGRTLFAQYSTHQELKLERRRHNSSPSSENLLVMGNGGAGNAAAATGGATASLDSTATQQQPNSVLRVIIENMLYPVTLDVLHGIFSRFGKVLRIITFNKNNTFQALVQLSEATAAANAKAALENQSVYTGCCTLRIDFSKLATLNVKYNNDKSRDYTNPNLPSGELTIEQQITLAAATGTVPSQLQSLLPAPYAFPFGAAPANAFLQSNSLGADGLGGQTTALSPFLSGLSQLNGSAGATSGQLSAGAAALTAAAGLRFPQLLGLTSVVLVSNLDETTVTPDALFTLFGVYGDVIRVKILFNKKDNALIQYSEPQQAQLAIQHLDKVRWHDKVIRVASSKHNNVQLPKEGQPDAGLTRDYSHSPLHRFKKPGSKNYMNIYPPSSTLHLSNIPPNVTEETLCEAFSSKGYAVKGFKFFPKDHKMALLQLDDVDTAINALIELHNHKLAENAHLRASFSKSGI